MTEDAGGYEKALAWCGGLAKGGTPRDGSDLVLITEEESLSWIMNLGVWCVTGSVVAFTFKLQTSTPHRSQMSPLCLPWDFLAQRLQYVSGSVVAKFCRAQSDLWITWGRLGSLNWHHLTPLYIRSEFWLQRKRSRSEFLSGGWSVFLIPLGFSLENFSCFLRLHCKVHIWDLALIHPIPALCKELVYSGHSVNICGRLQDAVC